MPNAFDAFNSANAAAYGQAQRSVDLRARMGAGRQLQAGNYQGAAGELYGSGMLEEGAQVQGMGQAQDARAQAMQTQQAEQADAQGAEQAKAKGEALIKISQALKSVPAGQRMGALQRLTPVFSQIGMDPSVFQGLGEQDLSDQALDMFSGEVQNQLKFFNTSSGIVGVEPDGEASLVYQDPLAAEYKRAQIGATNARAGASGASAEAARARAAKTRSGGGGRGGAPPSSGLPAGYRIKGG
jgi:hypothetical protein